MGFWDSLFGKVATPKAEVPVSSGNASASANSTAVPHVIKWPEVAQQPRGEWISPIDADGENFLANNLIADGYVTGAIAAYESCYAENPKHPDIVFNLASAYRRGGRFEDAVTFANLLLAINPGDDDALSTLERCAEKDRSGSEDWDAAKLAFDARPRAEGDDPHPAWPGVVILERNMPVEALGVRPPKFNIATCDGDGRNFYDVTIKITLANGETCRFRLHRTIPELRALARQGDKARARQIGEKLHDVGGFALMLGVGETLNFADRDARIFCDRMAFPGVGPWQG